MKLFGKSNALKGNVRELNWVMAEKLFMHWHCILRTSVYKFNDRDEAIIIIHSKNRFVIITQNISNEMHYLKFNVEMTEIYVISTLNFK